MISEMQEDMELPYPDSSDDAGKLELWVDASAAEAGAYFDPKTGRYGHRIIGFASKSYTLTRKNYLNVEKELSALRRGI